MGLKKTTRVDKTTGEITEGNPLFYQFYKKNFPVMQEISVGYPKALSLFLFLVSHMDTNNALVVSREALGEELDCSNTTVGRMITYLKSKNVLDIYKSGTTNVYCINTEIVWQSSDNNKKYAKFSASVYLSASEQVKTLRGDAKISKNTEMYGHYQTTLSEQMEATEDEFQRKNAQ